jgi:hypothetical protein
MQRTMHAAVGSTVAEHDSAALLVGHPADSVDPRKHALPHSLWCNATLLQRSNAKTVPFAALGGRAATARLRPLHLLHRCTVATLLDTVTCSVCIRSLQRCATTHASSNGPCRRADTADSAQDSAATRHKRPTTQTSSGQHCGGQHAHCQARSGRAVALSRARQHHCRMGVRE